MTDSTNPKDTKKPQEASETSRSSSTPATTSTAVFAGLPTKTSSKSTPNAFPVIPIREGILFPNTESVLTFGRKLSVNAIKAAEQSNNMVILLTQKKADTNLPKNEDLYHVGTLAVIERQLTTNGQLNALVKGVGRFKVADFSSFRPFISATGKQLHDEYPEADKESIQALATHLQKEFRKAVHMGKPVEFLNFMKLMSGVTNGELVDQIASTLDLSNSQKQQLLETTNVKHRLELVIDFLSKEVKVMEIEKDVVSKTQEKFDKNMRENVLRERLRTIQEELGDLDDEEEVVQSYEARLKKLAAPSEIKAKIKKEVKRLRQMSVNNPESGYVRTWLDTIFELPWGQRSKTKVNLIKANEILDTNHYGLSEVKDRVIEYMAVLKLKQDAAQKTADQVTTPTILCFVGPPGVGKTSIGKSIAEALGRKFVKVSLGGIRDEAEIRGHRRTYVGAMPGRIISGMKQAGSLNPVFMLDEVDKLGRDFRGDPSAALLETLDPEQNKAFEDHYLDAPFDLSEVLFITTANTLETIPPALRDRLEIVRYSGYTEEEKFHIAKNHLMQKVFTANGVTEQNLSLSDTIIRMLISRYTKEAGVRNLERTIGRVARKVARVIAEKIPVKSDSIPVTTGRITVTTEKLREYLGPEKFDVTLTEKEDQVGLATGLAWTSVGGDVLFIEVALSPGKGVIKLTGQLGDVMKESAQAAFTYVRSNAKKLGIDQKKIETTDVHIHIPEGAVPKDGPSAGITLTTAIVSAFTDQPIKRDVAMTGEVTLRGRVLRIGGLKEKSIAAHSAGCKTVLIPKENERDLVDVPDTVKKAVTFIPVSHVDEVLKLAFAKHTSTKRKKTA